MPSWFVFDEKNPFTDNAISGGVGAAIWIPAAGNPNGAPESEPPVWDVQLNQVLKSTLGEYE